MAFLVALGMARIVYGIPFMYIIIPGYLLALILLYFSDKDFIGIEKLSKKFLKHGYCTNDSILNRAQYFHQKIIARGERSDIDNVALIASYYPHLVLKDHDTILAN